MSGLIPMWAQYFCNVVLSASLQREIKLAAIDTKLNSLMSLKKSLERQYCIRAKRENLDLAHILHSESIEGSCPSLN